MSIKQPITPGERFGLYTVIEARPTIEKHRLVFARCDCGTTKVVHFDNLIRGKSKSCGCRTGELASVRNRTHGMSRKPEYYVWHTMKSRCCNPLSKRYVNYGGRGITVCELWRNSFQEFFAFMGARPGPNYSLDRIDNNGNYEPGNCRWTTQSTQNSNKRNSRIVTAFGKSQCLKKWANETGLNEVLLRGRLNGGWSAERALSKPVRKYHGSSRNF